MKFLKGSRDEFEKLKEESSREDKADIIQRQMAEVFGSKNLSFLMGAGCSSLRHGDNDLGIPTMKFLAKEFQTLLAADPTADAGQVFVSAAQRIELYDKLGIDLSADDVKENLEQMMAVLMNAHQFCKTSDKKELSSVAPLVENIIAGIKKFVLHKCTTGPFSNGDESIVALYQRFYQSLATRARGLAPPWVFSTNYSSMSARWIVQASRTPTVSRSHAPLDPSKDRVIIYPTPSKQTASFGSPYADMFREFQRQVVQDQSVLVTLGFSFGDEHVNNIIFQETLGSYLTVPMQAEYVVLEVVGLREKDNAPPHASQAELDKASSAKFLDVVPVGSMPIQGGSFRFGVSTFPPLYADALYARDEDLDRIFNVKLPSEIQTKQDAAGAEQKGSVPHNIEIGTSAVFKGYPVKSRLDELFGGHVAVLGNTGSGKSCTVASIFQSVLMKPEAFAALGAAFVIFDVNGEYRRALDNIPTWIKSCYLKASEPDTPILDPSPKRQRAEIKDRFKLPHWFMGVDEWALLLRASEKSQLPALRTALGLTTLFQETPEPKAIEGAGAEDSLKTIRNHVLAKIILSILHSEQARRAKWIAFSPY